jgi:hypothetical protein
MFNHLAPQNLLDRAAPWHGAAPIQLTPELNTTLVTTGSNLAFFICCRQCY